MLRVARALRTQTSASGWQDLAILNSIGSDVCLFGRCMSTNTDLKDVLIQKIPAEQVRLCMEGDEGWTGVSHQIRFV